MLSYLIGLFPLILLVVLFLSSGIYFTSMGEPAAFYQLSLMAAIMPSIALAWALNPDSTESKTNQLLDGAANRTIGAVFVIFLLVGAFNEVTKSIGSADAVTHYALTLMPARLLLVILFIVASFVSAAVGNSVASVAAIAPLAVGLSAQLGVSSALYVATVVGGAMLGDNLSPIYNTTFAEMMTKDIDAERKFKLKALLVLLTAAVIIPLLLLHTSGQAVLVTKPQSLILFVPYLLLLVLALYGVHIFVSLFVGIGSAGIIGAFVHHDYRLLAFCRDVQAGFTSMHGIMVLTFLVGALSGLASKHFTEHCANRLIVWLHHKKASSRAAQLVIAGVAGLFDVLLGNGAVSIMFSSEIAQKVAKEYKVPAYRNVAWLEIFTSIFQGIIPHGAHILIASSIAGISPLSIIPYVYFCYVLAAVSVVYILFFDGAVDRCE